MTRAVRVLGDLLVWLLAALGLVGVLTWGATKLGAIQPLVVVSGSMEPAIMTGDLLVDRPRPTAELEPGEVVSVPSEVTGAIITHRVVAVEPAPDSTWLVTLKGDANDVQDGEVYEVGDTVWQPALQVAGAGTLVMTLTRPTVAIPLLVALVALFGLTTLRPDEKRPARHAAEPAESR